MLSEWQVESPAEALEQGCDVFPTGPPTYIGVRDVRGRKATIAFLGSIVDGIAPTLKSPRDIVCSHPLSQWRGVRPSQLSIVAMRACSCLRVPALACACACAYGRACVRACVCMCVYVCVCVCVCVFVFVFVCLCVRVQCAIKCVAHVERMRDQVKRSLDS